jgi:hypothetical protein
MEYEIALLLVPDSTAGVDSCDELVKVPSETLSTVNWADASLTPVRTVIVLGPFAAEASILMLAVALVAPVTVTNPQPPGEPLPTEIPGPKLAAVFPFKKFVYVPVIATWTVWPAAPDDVSNVMPGGGFTVSEREFELE